ncbi:L,D-transpeptidase family protein [Agrobacterium vitis]|uniref:L,D-transpeptidase family protein n=1 Tax=Agrobacterium vitis TaxID=373 RepID=A0AAE5B9E1_AGRVI|nr:L,D-transpeptidase [Agrobacterium vitis]MCF1498377.1 L,D-transpeptidase [Allorhizobium sp. Av2]MCM2440504.1 L,D-transpeptidase [Agrobacterium vitis]MUO82341.1 L,D-transpeptidase family protein [Agrobacterium vitis]MUO97737.1 L,D-transpeptidase family protein [Agrobacterium vitis]MUP08192.1 L,D-transpeptidase family protein [Agrobacterium vitis]
MRIRNALTVLGLFSTLAITGCSTTSEADSKKTAEAAPVVAPASVETAQIFDDSYGPVTDAGYALPGIPIQKVNPKFRRQIIAFDTTERPGTIIVNTKERFLYYVLPNGKAIRYGIGVGKDGFAWQGQAYVAWKQEWPTWHPPKEMAVRKPEVAKYVEGGMGPSISNPLGARAMYLFNEKGQDTLFRIHGSPEWASIGTAASSGCIRMINQDVIDLYSRVLPGKATKVIVQQS